jgi:hypothetical protein
VTPEVIGTIAALHGKPNLTIWSAAIYCAQVVQDVVVVE